MFGFDERYAMFDVTPVENSFILEYLPKAKGDYVRVYLYGLMRCYHPEENMSPEQMSHELNMTEDDISTAFRYWERRGLVRRISDKPLRWQYVNIKQKDVAGGEPADREYQEFCDAVCGAFDKKRRLHGSEVSQCFEWKEELKLPTEVILMLLNHMVTVKGRNFNIGEANKVALRMAEEDILTVDAAETFLSRDEQLHKGTRKILKLLGKSYLPSEAQVDMYRKWLREWHFSHEAVEEAVKLTAKGDPSMGYLDGILKGMRQENAAGNEVKAEEVRASAERADELREVLKALGRGEVNTQNLTLYSRMTALYPQEVILAAARECGHSRKGPEEILKLLESWKEKGLESGAEVEAYVQSFHAQTELIRELRTLWGTDTSRIGQNDRTLVAKWEKEMGFSRQMILAAAPAAAEAKAPMAYLDSILAAYREKGITTPEEAEKARKQYRADAGKPAAGAGKTVTAQQYDQRDYQGVQEKLMEQQSREIEEKLRRKNGGKPDA